MTWVWNLGKAWAQKGFLVSHAALGKSVKLTESQIFHLWSGKAGPSHHECHFKRLGFKNLKDSRYVFKIKKIGKAGVGRTKHCFCSCWIICGQNGKDRVWATERSVLQAKPHCLAGGPGQVLVCIWTSVYPSVKWMGIIHQHISIIKLCLIIKANALVCQAPLIQVLWYPVSISIILIFIDDKTWHRWVKYFTQHHPEC